MKMWGGRFKQAPDPDFDRFNASFGFDYRLLEEDLRVNEAWAEALVRAGVLSQEECGLLQHALTDIRSARANGRPIQEPAEDVHSFVEAQLVARLGDLGYKIHTGRSRNDQVATDIRLYVKKHAGLLQQELVLLVTQILELARRHPDTPLPGYTHLQRAQPILLSHYLLSFEAMADRDYQRLRAAADSADEMPLGSGALAGTAYAVDRIKLAERLGFARITRNSVDAVSNRDFLCDLLYAAVLLMTHLSRLAADFILYSSTEFNFLRMGDSVTTGSSLMPQKRNPDAMELVRGKASAMEARLHGLIGLMRGLPSSYNKDLQEDKIPVFAAVEELQLTLKVARKALADVQFHTDVMRRAASDSYLLATDLADYLVHKGVPFRKAHHVVGEVVTAALSADRQLSELTLEELRRHHPVFDSDVVDWLDLDKSLKRRCIHGGTAPDQVACALQEAEQRWQRRVS